MANDTPERKFEIHVRDEHIAALEQEVKQLRGLLEEASQIIYEYAPGFTIWLQTTDEYFNKKKCCCWSFDHPPCPIHGEAKSYKPFSRSDEP